MLLLLPAAASAAADLLSPRGWVVSASRTPTVPPEDRRRDRWAFCLCALIAALFVLPVLAFMTTMLM